jgi:hypothetical protein
MDSDREDLLYALEVQAKELIPVLTSVLVCVTVRDSAILDFVWLVNLIITCKTFYAILWMVGELVRHVRYGDVSDDSTQIHWRPPVVIPAEIDAAKIPVEYKCPITHDIMKSPAITCYGITYERAAIEEWLSYNRTDPSTQQRLKKKDVRPNYALQDCIQGWVNKTYPSH